MVNQNIRNFSIIAHIDHGKTTLTDRLLLKTDTISERMFTERMMDSNPIEQERGITIKMAPVRMEFPHHDKQMIFNLIDTPGHVDFSYEVSRSLAAVEGAILLVDATQGIQAQTLSHFDKTKNHDLKIIPVLNKVDLPNLNLETIQLEMMELSEGEMIQYALHAWFLKRDKRGSLTVDVQDPKKTNILLADAGISVYDLDHYLPEELAEILHVDAVVMGTFETDRPMSEEAAVAIKLLFGVWGKTNAAVINLSIHNGRDGMLLVNYNKGVSRSFGSTPDELVNTLMRKASRRIAYTRG